MDKLRILPNGCMLYVEECEETGGRRYYSDEVGGGVCVWDTALVDSSTLLSAIVEEERMRKLEIVEQRLVGDNNHKLEG